MRKILEKIKQFLDANEMVSMLLAAICMATGSGLIAGGLQTKNWLVLSIGILLSFLFLVWIYLHLPIFKSKGDK